MGDEMERQTYDYAPLIPTGMAELDHYMTPDGDGYVAGLGHGVPPGAVTHFFSSDGSHLEVGRNFAENAAALGLRVELMTSVDVAPEGVQVVPFDLGTLGSTNADLTVVEMLALPMLEPGPRARFGKALMELSEARQGLMFSTHGDDITVLKYHCRMRVEFEDASVGTYGLLKWNIVKSQINANQGVSGVEASPRMQNREAWYETELKDE